MIERENTEHIEELEAIEDIEITKYQIAYESMWHTYGFLATTFFHQPDGDEEDIIANWKDKQFLLDGSELLLKVLPKIITKTGERLAEMGQMEWVMNMNEEIQDIWSPNDTT